jgi:hypothetical protein
MTDLDKARARLREALDWREHCEANLRSANSAEQAAKEHKWSAQAELRRLREEAPERASDASFYAAVASGDLDLLERPSARADAIQKAEHQVEIWQAAQDRAMRAVEEGEEACRLARYSVDEAIKRVLQASGWTERLFTEYQDALKRMFAIRHMLSFAWHEGAALNEISSEIVKHLNHVIMPDLPIPAEVAAWREAIAKLRVDADAALPESLALST